jgi:hypothetical protein
MIDNDESPSRQSLKYNEVNALDRPDRRLDVDGLPSRESSRGKNFDRVIPGHPAMKNTKDYLGLTSSLYEPGALLSVAMAREL